MKFNRRIVLLILLIIAVLIIFMPIKVNYSFESTALVYSSRDWNLKRGQDDSYITELVDNQTNVISDLMSYKFERGDVAEVKIRKDLVSGEYVTRDDTIAVIHSYFIESQLAELYSMRDIEKAAYIVTSTGEKQALIDQSEQELEFARRQLDLAGKNYERQKKLFADSIISLSEFEIYENQFNLAQINVEIAEKELLSLKTGAKSEEIGYIQQKIDSYEKEIATLELRRENYFIKPPIEGVVSYNRVLDGIISISDTSRYILKIPVKINNIRYLDKISSIKFSIPGSKEQTDASFVGLDESVNFNITSSQQLIIGKALIENGVKGLYPGMAVNCKVFCDRITISEYLRRGIHFKF
jgi:hypothetical protein